MFSLIQLAFCASVYIYVYSKKAGLKLNIQITKTMAFGPISSWQIDGETMKTVIDFIFLGSKITADGDCSHEIKRHLLLGRKAMTKLDSILKSRDITLPTKVRLVKAMVFPVVMYGCWTVKKAVLCSVAQSCWTLCESDTHGLQATRLLCPSGFSGQDYQSGLPCLPPGDPPNSRTEPRSSVLQTDSLPSETPGTSVPKN